MAGGRKKADAPGSSSKPPLSIDDITDRAFNRFKPKAREGICRDDVRKLVAELNLAKLRPTRKVPRLMIRRLRFKGLKSLDGSDTPIDYDQAFATGVNALVIEDNLVGKSSILKTIKFGLTGHDDEYDQAVRDWIKEIWLEFSLDEQVYTILLARREDGLHGRLAFEAHSCPIEEIPKHQASRGFYVRGVQEVQQALESFFVNEFGLATLGWNVTHPAKDGSTFMAWASWQTYFQALRIPDDSHTYLLCRPEFANQDQILFSAFLGLHLSEPLNHLSMEAASLKKAKEFSNEQLTAVADRKSKLVDRRANLRRELGELDEVQARRLKVLMDGDLANQLIATQGDLIESDLEVAQIGEQTQNLNTQVRQSYATARRLREQIDLSRELTGLQVTLCPNCARAIDQEAVQREKSSHQCRLCIRPVPEGSEDEAAILEATAKEYDQKAVALTAQLEHVKRNLTAAQTKSHELSLKAESLRAKINEGAAKGLPTPDEAERRGRLHEEIGEINYEITTLEQNPGRASSPKDHEKRSKIIEQVRVVLKEEADERNKEIEARLNELAQDVVKALRADQISGIKCYPTGVVKLTKNGENIAFTKIMNPGERYRAKLALFLAMMRLGCEAGIGKHPGFLMLDQLGGAEMVPEDLQASAAALRRIEEEFSERVQIICFTARPEFREATVADKVYGHRITAENGKKYAF